MKQKWVGVFLVVSLAIGCAKVYRTATPVEPNFIEKKFAASPNDAYYALRWALRSSGYPIGEEDLVAGVIRTRYVPVKANSHYVDLFGHKDYGVTGAYHQLELQVTASDKENTEIRIGSRTKGIVSNLKSSLSEEKAVLVKIGHYLRSKEMDVTNLGLQD